MLEMYSKRSRFQKFSGRECTWAALETGVSFFNLCLLQSFLPPTQNLIETLITHDYIHSEQK